MYFVRHLEKEYSNGKGSPYKPKFDPGITETEYSFDLPKNPSKVISSPFSRCVESCKAIYGKQPEIECKLREYLGHWSKCYKNNFNPETWSHIKNIMIIESENIFRSRIKSYLLNLSYEENTVIFTHGFCIFLIYRFFIDLKEYKITKLGTEIEEGIKIDKISN